MTDTHALLKSAYLEIKDLRSRLSEPIAVVGMGCRYPGGASDAEAFWSLLRDGVDAVRPVPSDRWDTEAYFDDDPDAPGKLYVRHGAFLEGIDQFDAAFFGISPLEASTMDPQQRLLLEVAWEALENAGIAADQLRASRTGIFVGLMYQDYLARQLREGGAESIGPYLGTGTTFSAAAGRLSYVLGLQGPSIAIDTACSSSLVSIHLACQSLRNRECDTALAGGANVMVTPEASINLSKARMMSPTGRCRTFDAAADGYIRGEGCGLLVLKRLSQAKQDGDRILGLIRGSAVNQDGRSNGLTAPNGSAQRALLRDALAAARVQPEDVGYIECHGTGTPLGDPIEVSALLSVYGARAADNPLAIGSVKTNFGHLESAAGVCGLMKALLVVRHGELPPHLHFQQLNPNIDLGDTPVVIPTERRAWSARLAAVSAFGFAGTNAHVIVEAYDEPPAPAQHDRETHVLTLSAATEPALAELVQRYAHVSGDPGDICYTANTGRARLSHRAAMIWSEGMWAGLQPGAGLKPGLRSLALLFTGQGSLTSGITCNEPLFRAALDACERHLGITIPWNDAAKLEQTGYAQPALFALGTALFALWRAWGIEPSVVLGHSVGELVAAYAAGIFSLEDGAKIIAARARLMQALPPGGAMAAVLADEAWASQAIAGSRMLSIAAINGPTEVVLSGDGDELRRAIEGMPARLLPVSHAFHSPLMQPMLGEFAEVLRGVTFHRPALPILSNVTGKLVEGDEMSNADYWLRHVLAPVRFRDAAESLRGALLLELGPRPILGPLVARMHDDVVPLHGLQTAESLAALFEHGIDIDWKAVDRPFARRKVTLPTYPFQRERHWLKPTPARRLLGEPLPQSAHDPSTTVWSADVHRPYLREHKLLGTPVWPIAAQLELALSAAPEGSRVTNVEFQQTLYSDVAAVQTVRSGDELRIYSSTGKDWTLNTRARIERERNAGIDLSAMFFAAKEDDADRYRLIVEAAKYADRAGFRSVWVPERHFTHMGSLYPNPSVLHAALARETKRVRLMAGSVVLPLHHPVRIAEEWAMVDNLSGGRVGLSVASGWNPNDFVLAPGKYEERFADLYAGIDTLRRLWRGDTIESTSASGKVVKLRTYPTPLQRELPLWVTAARSPESFRKAGALGANLLTHLLDQDVETLASKIAMYRAARAENGFDPGSGIVTVMCHTFVAPDLESVHRMAKTPFCEYLKSSRGLLAGLAYSRGQDVDVDALSDRELDELVEFLYERFRSTRALIGTPESCRELVAALHAAGVNEIACLLDFGPTTEEVLAHLPYLENIRESRIANRESRRAEVRCERERSVQQFYDDLASTGVDFEGSLRNLASLSVGKDEALAEIRPSAEPAIVIDAALQAALATLDERSSDLLVPAAVGAVRAYAPLTGRLFSHARRRGLTADVTLFREGGEVVLEVEALQVKRVPRPVAEPEIDDWFYEVAWRPLESIPKELTGQPWIILEDRRGLALQWAKLNPAQHLYIRRGAVTEAVGPRRWTVNPSDGGFARLLAQIDAGTFAGILDLWPLDDVSGIEPAQRAGVEAIIALLQAAERQLPRLWIVKRNDLAHATLWGLAGAIAREHAEWWGGIIELDETATAADLDRALRAGDREDQVAIRDGQRFARRIVRAASAPAQELTFCDDATYVIAGGQGGLGLATAEWMRERGAKHVLLLGRSAVIPTVSEGPGREGSASLATHPVPSLNARDDAFDYASVDIADEAQLAGVLARVEHPIRGVVHAAGVFQDESLLRLDRDLLWDVMRARVLGAWTLHRALENAELDFFVLFSSFSALTPPHGQAAYAAASSFMDALAQHRRASGKPAVSINWGAWSEVGFAATDVGRDAHAQLEEMGMRRMTPRQGIAALERVMRSATPAQIAVFPELERVAAAEPSPLLKELAAPVAVAAAPPVALLARMEPAEQAAFVRAQLARIAAEVLQIALPRLDVAAPLTSLGLDSLIAVQLKNRMQKEAGLTIPLVNALRGGSVASLADELLVELRVHAVRPLAFPPVPAGAQQEIEL